MSRWKRSNGTAEAAPDPDPDVALDPAGANQAEKPRDVGSRWGRNVPNVPDLAAAPQSCMPESRTFNFQSSVTLRGGTVQMPTLGLGTRQLKGNECREAVKHALRCGYRLLDTAPGFGNEEEIAHGIRGAALKREDVFLVSKLPPSEHGDELEEPLTSTLQNLGTSYLDLYLIQSPKGGSLLWTWDAMIQLRDRGLVKAVGLCNVSVAHLEALARTGRELPQVLQTELHLAHQQKDLCDFCRSHGIILMSTSPLARGALLKTSPLKSMAERLRRTAAEVAIRWCLQQGFVTIPKTKTAMRLESNAAFGFTLTEEDVDPTDPG
eukprot:symbB.v1.2.003264.t1/scaffold117.1/size318901/3